MQNILSFCHYNGSSVFIFSFGLISSSSIFVFSQFVLKWVSLLILFRCLWWLFSLMAFSLNKIELWLFEFWWYVWWDKRLSWEFHIFISLYVLLCISIVSVLLALRFSLRFGLVDRRTSGYDFGSNCLTEFDLVLVVYFPLGTKAFPLSNMVFTGARF